MFNSRQEDLSKVFDKTWQANHNDVAKRGKEREKKFMNKMFNTNSNIVNSSLTPGQSAKKLQNDIDNAFNGYRQNTVNNIVKKWK